MPPSTGLISIIQLSFASSMRAISSSSGRSKPSARAAMILSLSANAARLMEAAGMISSWIKRAAVSLPERLNPLIPMSAVMRCPR
jgi:hypothetical protein